MKIPLLSRLRKASRKRAFARDNPDLRRVFGAGDACLLDTSSAAAPLSPVDMRHWDDLGFLVLKGHFAPSVIDSYKSHVDRIWNERSDRKNPLVIYSERGGHYFRDAIEEDRLQTYRLLDQYLVDAATRELCADPRLRDVLRQLLGYDPVVCNSILFEWGSEQDMHSDMFYMPPVSENQMLATWIALDDVTDDNGPLLYVPGSHKLPPHRFSHGHVHAVTEEVADAVAAMRERMAAHGLRTEKFMAERGDVLIWHSQLVHGGDAIRDRSARRTSLVTHYYSTCDVPKGAVLCAETAEGSLLLVKDHVRFS